MMDVLFGTLLESPVFDVDRVCAITEGTPRASYDVIAKLEELGIIKEITRRKRDRLWSVPEVFEVIDGLERRIGRRKMPG